VHRISPFVFQVLKKEIRKEMKIKEGAEKLREVSTDKKSLSNVSSIVKKANTKLQQLHQELQDLNACLLVTNTTSQDVGTGRCCVRNSRISVPVFSSQVPPFRMLAQVGVASGTQASQRLSPHHQYHLSGCWHR